MSPEEVEALLVEMEPEIRAADRDVREIEIPHRTRHNSSQKARTEVVHKRC